MIILANCKGMRSLMMIESTVEKLLFCAYFVSILVIGVIGNLWVILTILKMLHGTVVPISNVFRRTSFYILLLCIVDLLVLCTVPMLISYFIGGNWHFGFLGCKLFFAVENVNKLLSVEILAVMSIERFLTISRPFYYYCCHTQKSSLRNILFIVFLLFFVIIVLCIPIIYYAGTQSVTIYHNGMVDETVICLSNLPDNMMLFFICYMFLIGFILPHLFISTCYFFLIRHLRRNGRSLFTTSYSKKVIGSVLCVVIFHFICWTPFWIFVLIPIFSYFGIINLSLLQSKNFQTLRMISSFLPYLNSAGNWIFYAAMNRELRNITWIPFHFHLKSHNTKINRKVAHTKNVYNMQGNISDGCTCDQYHQSLRKTSNKCCTYCSI